MKRTTPLLAIALLFAGCSQPQSIGTEPLPSDPSPSVATARAPVIANVKSAGAAEKRGPPRFTVPIDGLPLMGNRDALVTLVELTDYDCAYCARAEHTVHSLREKYGTDLRVAIAE